jgi:GNAT superfamily N-acetyltransferase
VLENRRLNNWRKEHTAFFYLFEAIESFDVTEALFDKAIDWVRARHLNRLVGPKGFLTIDPVGMLAQGFERFPAMGMPWNYSYYNEYMERLGFEKETDYLSGWIPIDFPVPDRIFRIAEIAKKRYGYTTRTYHSKKELIPVVKQVIDAYNRSFIQNWEFAPVSDSEAGVLAHRILSVIDDATLPQIVWKDDVAVGFILAYPDINRAIQQTGGRLWPTGWWRLMRAFKQTEWIDLNGIGILPEHRGRGVDAILVAALWQSVHQSSRGYQYAELCQINEKNAVMQREMAAFGVAFDKRHRIYAKMIA